METIEENSPLENSVLQNHDDSQTKESWYAPDKDMLSSKFVYFFQQSKDSCYLPYMNIFLISAGLNAVQAGQVNGLRFIGAIIGSPLWGIVADLKQSHRVVATVLCIMAMVTISSQPFIAVAMTGKNEEKCVSNLKNISRNQTTMNSNISNMATVDKTTLFYVMMIINVIASSFDGSTIGFVDSGVVQKILSRTKPAKFGIQRLFGAFGFGSGTFISSVMVEYFPRFDLPCYSPALFVYGFLTLFLTISISFLYRGLSFSSNNKGTNQNKRKLLRTTLFKFHTLFFLLTVLITGTVHGFYLCYLFVLLKQINCPNVIMGLSILTGALSAFSIFIFLEKIIKILGGTIEALFVGCFSWAIRLLLTSYIKNPYLILPIQSFQAFGFALFLGAGVTHVKLISSPEIFSSMYGIFNGLFYGVGLIIANVAGGVILSEYGVRKLFFTASTIAFIWSFFMFSYILTQRCSNRSKEKTDNILLEDKNICE